MPRAALFTLLVASVLNGSLQAQRATATFHGNAAGQPVRSGFAGQRGFPNRFFPRRGFVPSGFHRHDGFSSIFVPYSDWYDGPVGYEQPDAEAVRNGPVPPVEILRTPEPPVPEAQVIEIPSVADSTAAKVLPPTIFILANGEPSRLTCSTSTRRLPPIANRELICGFPPTGMRFP